MSYTTSRALGDLTSVDVGKRAFADPVLAHASLDASKIMLAMSRVPPAQRLNVMENKLTGIDGTLPKAVVAEMQATLRPGKNPDQVAFDAMRLAIANRRMAQGLDRLRMKAVHNYGWDSVLDTPLGDISANDKQIGCTAAGAGQVVGNVVGIVPVYGSIIGGLLNVGSGAAASALDCGSETREAQAAATAAQQQLAAAQAQAAMAQAATVAQARTQHLQTMAISGGILLTVLAGTWMLLK